MTILVIEDDDGCRDSLCEVLFCEGYLAASAESADKALEMLRTGLRPDLIICDVLMPGMTPAEFRKKQRKIDSLAHVPFVLSTATRAPYPTDCDGVLVKPYSMKMLSALLARLAPYPIPRVSA